MSDAEWVAAVGSVLLLLAFFMNQRGVLRSDSLAYLLLNLLGSGIAGIAAWMGGIMPFVVLEAVWGAVAALGLWSLFRRSRERAV